MPACRFLPKGSAVMAKLTYKPSGVCSRAIHIETENGIITHIDFEGGCAGNTKGVAALARTPLKDSPASSAASRAPLARISLPRHSSSLRSRTHKHQNAKGENICPIS